MACQPKAWPANCLLYLRALRHCLIFPAIARWLLQLEALEYRHARSGFHDPGLRPQRHPEPATRQDHRPEFLGHMVSAMRRRDAFAAPDADRKRTRLNSSHSSMSYA